MPEQKRSSHLGAGMLIGAAIGVASAVFLQSKKGKELTKDLQKKVAALQKKIMKELEDVEDMTKEKYEQLVDRVVEHYVKTQEIVKKEIPEVKKSLMGAWKTVEKQLKELRSGSEE
jgi:gas vesicle protein